MQKISVSSLKLIVRSAALTAMATPCMVLAQPVDDDAWHVSVGMGLISQPKYPGSSDTRMGPMPTFSATKGRFQIGALPGAAVPLGLGYTLLQEGPWRFGVGIGTSLGNPRGGNDGSNLSGLGEIKQTTLGTVSGSYTQGPMTTMANLITDIGGHDQGTRATLDVMFRTRPGRLVWSAGPGITWMNSQYAQTYYGVTAAQSTSSGYSTYQASAGVNAVRLGAGVDYELTREWRLSAKASVSKLQSDAANSPTIDKGTQSSYGVFANYRF